MAISRRSATTTGRWRVMRRPTARAASHAAAWTCTARRWPSQTARRGRSCSSSTAGPGAWATAARRCSAAVTRRWPRSTSSSCSPWATAARACRSGFSSASVRPLYLRLSPARFPSRDPHPLPLRRGRPCGAVPWLRSGQLADRGVADGAGGAPAQAARGAAAGARPDAAVLRLLGGVPSRQLWGPLPQSSPILFGVGPPDRADAAAVHVQRGREGATSRRSASAAAGSDGR